MQLLKVVTFFFLIHSWSFATDFAQVDYSGIWNLSFEFNGKKISKNEILIFKTTNRFNDSTMYSVRGYLRHEEILAMFAYFDEENKVYKIRFMTLNTGIPHNQDIIQGDMDHEVFSINANSTIDVLQLTSPNGLLHNIKLSKEASFQ